MLLKIGYEIVYSLPQPTPMILLVNVHSSRTGDLAAPDWLTTDPYVPVTGYLDGFGNWCSRLTAPAGRIRLSATAAIRDSGLPDPMEDGAGQLPVEGLPDDTLVYLLGSRYCETDMLTAVAWQLFEGTPPGFERVQAICDYVHNHIAFNYQNARSTRSAGDVFQERTGVCRDFAHLAVAFCRCMNIPARYCTGYLSNSGEPVPAPPADFAAWFEAYIGGRWHTFDPRNNKPRIGRVLMARGRDAADVAIVTTFGPNYLESFQVWAEEIPASPDGNYLPEVTGTAA